MPGSSDNGGRSGKYGDKKSESSNALEGVSAAFFCHFAVDSYM